MWNMLIKPSSSTETSQLNQSSPEVICRHPFKGSEIWPWTGNPDRGISAWQLWHDSRLLQTPHLSPPRQEADRNRKQGYGGDKWRTSLLGNLTPSDWTVLSSPRSSPDGRYRPYQLRFTLSSFAIWWLRSLLKNAVITISYESICPSIRGNSQKARRENRDWIMRAETIKKLEAPNMINYTAQARHT